MQNTRIFKMAFASVYPHYVVKVEKKGRTVDELHTVIEWLTGYDEKKLKKIIADKTNRLVVKVFQNLATAIFLPVKF